MADYTINKARYAKKMMAIHITQDGSEWKNRAERMAASLSRERYSGRENAYILSVTAAARFEKLYVEGWDAGYHGALISPKTQKNTNA